MLFATIMLCVLGSLFAAWRQHGAAIPLFLLALAATAIAFATDLTTVLKISL
jgi:hypothetical protein